MVNTVRPKASDTPMSPIPTLGKPAASTALPHPPKTSQKVPNTSAMSLRDNGMALDATSLQVQTVALSCTRDCAARVVVERSICSRVRELNHDARDQQSHAIDCRCSFVQ